MALVMRQIGSLSEIEKNFKIFGIYEVSPVNTKTILNFQENYGNKTKEIIDKTRIEYQKNILEMKLELKELINNYEREIKERNDKLNNEIEEIKQWLDDYNSKSYNLLHSFIKFLLKFKLTRRLTLLENGYDEFINKPLEYHANKIKELKEKLEYKEALPDICIKDMSRREIERLEYIQKIINDNKNLIYGAIGENKAQEELKKLPEQYIVINNFYREFRHPIYDKRNHDHIYSIQIDHIVLGPTGIYLIETKNWSKESINSLDLFSPVKQLLRSSYAVFVCLNGALKNSELYSFNNHWGVQKISPKNIILMVDNKPVKEFQYVKILSLPEVNKYICYGDQIFSSKQVEELSKWLMRQID